VDASYLLIRVPFNLNDNASLQISPGHMMTPSQFVQKGFKLSK